MSRQNEETISTKFILALGLVLGSFFWIHAHNQASRTIAPDTVTLDKVSSPSSNANTTDTELYPEPMTTAALPSER